MNNLIFHKNLCDELNKTYEQKDKRYGSSFSHSYKKYGKISALTRMSDKWNRLENLMLNPELNNDKTESLIDTLKDLANYALMTVIELEEERKKELPF